MSIVKLEISLPELKKFLETAKVNRLKVLEQVVLQAKMAVEEGINQILNTEMSVFLGQANQVDNKRNGYSVKTYALKGIGAVNIRMPIDRRRRFESLLIPKNERMDPRLKEDLAILHCAGLSTRTLALLGKRLLNVEFSHGHIANCLPAIKEQALAWLQRPLSSVYWCLIIDGTNFSIRRKDGVEKEPRLVVLGVDVQNRKSILAIEPGHRDQSEVWRQVFKDLKKRGLVHDQIRLGVMDGLSGLETVFKEEFPHSQTARCWFHALANATAKTPKRYQEAFDHLIKKVMYASDETQARAAFATLKRSVGDTCARAIACIEKDLDALCAHYSFEQSCWRALKTTNSVERIHKEFKRRTKSMESVGENTLQSLVAFIALKLELGWQRRSVDTFNYETAAERRQTLKRMESMLFSNQEGSELVN